MRRWICATGSSFINFITDESRKKMMLWVLMAGHYLILQLVFFYVHFVFRSWAIHVVQYRSSYTCQLSNQHWKQAETQSIVKRIISDDRASTKICYRKPPFSWPKGVNSWYMKSFTSGAFLWITSWSLKLSYFFFCNSSIDDDDDDKLSRNDWKNDNPHKTLYTTSHPFSGPQWKKKQTNKTTHPHKKNIKNDNQAQAFQPPPTGKQKEKQKTKHNFSPGILLRVGRNSGLGSFPHAGSMTPSGLWGWPIPCGPHHWKEGTGGQPGWRSNICFFGKGMVVCWEWMT